MFFTGKINEPDNSFCVGEIHIDKSEKSLRHFLFVKMADIIVISFLKANLIPGQVDLLYTCHLSDSGQDETLATATLNEVE